MSNPIKLALIDLIEACETRKNGCWPRISLDCVAIWESVAKAKKVLSQESAADKVSDLPIKEDGTYVEGANMRGANA